MMGIASRHGNDVVPPYQTIIPQDDSLPMNSHKKKTPAGVFFMANPSAYLP